MAPAPVPPTVVSYPQETRDRLLRILNQEWREWGSQTVDARDGSLEKIPNRLEENDRAAFSKVLAYWIAVGNQSFINRNKFAYSQGSNGVACTASELKSDGDPVIWGCQPWSAAFISYVARSAGIDRLEFAPSDGHRGYVDALDALAATHGGKVAFYPREINAYRPRVGDLVCSDRSEGPRISTMAERRKEVGLGRPMHCDFVVAVRPDAVEVIGGNVGQGVTKVIYKTEQGFLQRNARHWFVIFENRIGTALNT
ncbi:DUF2272 domain-containing protein [Belnapia sp. F-4-1]|uniref:DUF2272 domain-containing protein n=1 Tax=Belnapia sp. F-4-1 TaxID=1545443 RepID=UPI00350F3D93